MHSGWQDYVIGHVGKKALYFDPRSHQLRQARDYVQRDLAFIQTADIVFAYLEKSNPSGFGLAVELGFARALGKRIIFVNETKNRYTRFMDEVADFHEANLTSGTARLMAMLQSFQRRT